MAQVDYVQRFIDFIENFKDERGELKYIKMLKQVREKAEKTLTVYFSDFYRYDWVLAVKLLNKPEDILPKIIDELEKLINVIDSAFNVKTEEIGIVFKVDANILLGLDNTVHEYEGIVIFTGKVERGIVRGCYRHEKCNSTFFYELSGKGDKPTSCPLCRKGGKFKLIPSMSAYGNFQNIFVSNLPNTIKPDEKPIILQVILKDDLAGLVKPGDHVVLTGLWRKSVIKTPKPKFVYWLEAIDLEIKEKAPLQIV